MNTVFLRQIKEMEEEKDTELIVLHVLSCWSILHERARLEKRSGVIVRKRFLVVIPRFIFNTEVK